MRFLFLLFLAALLLPAPAFAIVPTQEKPVVVLRMLDKMTARVEEIDLAVGKTIQFGTLGIIARTCRTTAPEETPPESAAYLEIGEISPGEPSKTIFNGWMFASSPALSAMEHPIYDLWVTGCRDSSKDEKKSPSP